MIVVRTAVIPWSTLLIGTLLAATCLIFMPAHTWAFKDASGPSLTQMVKTQLQSRLGAILPLSGVDDPLGQGLPQIPIVTFYSQRHYSPAWINDRGLTPLAGSFVDVLQQVQLDGLVPTDYRVPQIDFLLRRYEEFRAGPSVDYSAVVAELDLLLTQAFLSYAEDQIGGRVDPARLEETWHTRPRDFDTVLILQHALQPDRMSRVLQDLAPPHSEYVRLRETLHLFRQQANQGGWPHVPDNGPLLRPSEWDDRLPLIRRFLFATGDLSLLTEEERYYDDMTVAGVKRFQARHGLNPDGVIGPVTMAAMQVPIEYRIQQILLNMERWRWLPQRLGETHVRVNIAGFDLQVYDKGRMEMEMAVVVGKKYRKTPVFSDRIRYLEFAPAWHVPPTILEEDLLPQIQEDPYSWFEQNSNYSIIPLKPSTPDERVDPWELDWEMITHKNFPGMLRHEPGPANPLGQVKFMFPNKFSIYLHDTPTRNLFRQQKRTFSSGCIRVEQPVELAEFLLENQDDWPLDRVLESMEATDTSRVRLKKPVPVHILYWTAWTDEYGRPHFRPDVYQRDTVLSAALENHSNQSVQLAGTYRTASN